LYNAPTPSFIILCLLVRKLLQTDATENIQHSSLCCDIW